MNPIPAKNRGVPQTERVETSMNKAPYKMGNIPKKPKRVPLFRTFAYSSFLMELLIVSVSVYLLLPKNVISR